MKVLSGHMVKLDFYSSHKQKISRLKQKTLSIWSAISSQKNGQHGILIFSCLLFVLFEKTNPDIFVWSLSLCYTMVGLGIYYPKILCIQKIAEIGYFTFKNITNTFAKLWKLTNFCLNFTSKCFLPYKTHAYRYSSKLSVWTITRPFFWSSISKNIFLY